MVFSDDLVLLATSEGNLPHSVYNLNTVTTTCNMKMSTEKAKILAFQGKEPIPSRVCVDNRILERVNKFTYLDYTLSYQREVDISNKTAKYTKAMGVIMY
jgi:hypothetical protein